MEQPITKLYNTFTKGLVTETSPLNTDYKASTDENNCVLYIKGNRTRRLGVDYETGAQLVNVGINISSQVGILGYVNPNDTNPLNQYTTVDWNNQLLYCWQGGGDGAGQVYRRDLQNGTIYQSSTITNIFGAGSGHSFRQPTICSNDGTLYIPEGQGICKIQGSTLTALATWGTGGGSYPSCFDGAWGNCLTASDVAGNTYITVDSGNGVIQILNGTTMTAAGWSQTLTETNSCTTNGWANSSQASLWTVARYSTPSALGISIYNTVIYAGAEQYSVASWPTQNQNISIQKTGSVLPSAVDPTWTHMTAAGCLYDYTDNTLITYVTTTDSVTQPYYLIKIKGDGTIVWVVPAWLGIDDEFFKQSYLHINQLLVTQNNGGAYFLINTTTGGVTNVSSELIGVQFEGGSYNPKLQCFVCPKGEFTEETGSPPVLYGTTGFSFTPGAIFGIPGLNISANITGLPIEEFKWVGVNQIDKDILVVQVGGTLYFFDIDGTPFSGRLLPFTVDLTQYAAPFSTPAQVALTPVDFACGQGFLFVSGANTEPFVVTFNPLNNTISTTQINIQIRDFIGLNDGLAPDEEPSTLTASHHYNLKNQGWNTPNGKTNYFGESAPLYDNVNFFNDAGQVGLYNAPGDAPILRYYADETIYPANNKQFWIGVDSTGTWSDDVYLSFSAGNTIAPRGHYVLNAFNMDYSAFSGITGLTPKVTNIRPPTISFFAGRVWYAAGTSVYFSQVLQPGLINNCGKCYQSNDPTDQTINQLVASDGGTALIPEMGQAVKLSPIGTGMMVFATNGVWFVGGGSGNFSATDLAITKISNIGMNSPRSVVSVDSDVYWWSKIGIQGVSQKSGIFGPVQGNVDKLNISEATIKTFYLNQVSPLGYTNTKGMYDPATNTISWLFQSPTCPLAYCFDRMLNYNLSTTGFYPYTISSAQTGGVISTPWICGRFETVNVNVIPSQIDDRKNTYACYLTLVPTNNNTELTFSFLNSNTFMDWFTFNSVGYTFDSYLETNYEMTRNWSNFEVSPNALVKKTAPWIVTYFKRTETQWLGNDTTGYEPSPPSSCFLTAQWDWSTSTVSNRWYGPYQVYRLGRVPFVDSTNLSLDTGFLMNEHRFKVRGMGRALQLRFESEQGKDFNLLGWEVDMGVNMKA